MIHLEAMGLHVRSILGSGSFAQVYQCFDPKENALYAVKMIQKQSMPHSKIRLFFKEAEILSSIDHKNIVKFYSFHETDQCLIIKMELVKGGTLKKLIEDHKKERVILEERQIALLFKNLLEGIKYLHALNIIHRDLKLENILFEDVRDLTTVKIVDFGLSAKLEIHNPMNIKAQCGTLLYMAPEIFNKPSYTKSIDLWSCAVIMFMLFNQGRHPFYYPGMKTQQFKLKLKKEEFPPLDHPLAQNFLQKISKKEYQQRYNVNDALKHPWITRNDADQIPLSIHQSFKGFDSTNSIILLLRLYLSIGSAVSHQRAQIGASYRIKINEFINKNEAVRVYSPSRRKMKDKNNQLFSKMKKIIHINQNIKNNEMMSLSANFSEEVSPTLKKHESFFQSIFEKQKSFELVKNNQHCEPQRLQFENAHSFYNISEKEELIYSQRSKRKIAFQQQLKNEKFNLEQTILKCEDLKQKIAHQIEHCTPHSKKRSQSISKKRIFHKKSSIEAKQPKDKVPDKIAKKFPSLHLEKLEQSSKKDYNFFISSKQISNRRVQSPSKNGMPKSVVFHNGSKNNSQTSRK